MKTILVLLTLLVLPICVQARQEPRELRFPIVKDAPLTLPSSGVYTDICFSPDGRYLATYTDVAAKVWECATGKLIYHSQASQYDGQLNWKGSGRISVRFLNNSTIVDSGQRLVDLDNGIAEPIREWNNEAVSFFPLDADHGFLLESGKISLINRAEKLAIWTFDLWSIRDRKSAPILDTTQLGIDLEKGRVVFHWEEKESIVSSLSLEGDDYQEEGRQRTLEVKGYRGYKSQVRPQVSLSPGGKLAVLYNKSGTAIYESRMLVLGEKRKPIPLQLPVDSRSKDAPSLAFTRLRFLDENNVEYFQQEESGRLTSVFYDAATGKAKERITVTESRSIGAQAVTLSPDHRIAAALRFLKSGNGYFWTVGLYDAQTGVYLRSLDDSAQSLALSQSETAMYERSKAARAAAEEAARLARAAQRAEQGRVLEAEIQRIEATTRKCGMCKGAGIYKVFEKKWKVVEDFIPVKTERLLNTTVIYGVPYAYGKLATEEVGYRCPCCKGTGRIPK